MTATITVAKHRDENKNVGTNIKLVKHVGATKLSELPWQPGQTFTKKEGVALLASLGYTEHYSTGSCGDYAYGSRLYYSKPNAKKNRSGLPLQHATLSKIRNRWHLSVFE